MACVLQPPDDEQKGELTLLTYAVLDSGRLEQLGWRARYGIREGIEDMLQIKQEIIE